MLLIFFIVNVAGKSPFFPSLDEQGGNLLEDPSQAGQLDGVGVGVGVGVGGGMSAPQTAPLSSPSRSSPHSQGSETGERFSRKVFVGGLPPDIDEGTHDRLSPFSIQLQFYTVNSDKLLKKNFIAAHVLYNITVDLSNFFVPNF